MVLKMLRKLCAALTVGYSLLSSIAYADLLPEQRCYYTGRSALVAPGAIVELNPEGYPEKECVRSLTELIEFADGKIGEKKDNRISPREFAYAFLKERYNLDIVLSPDYVSELGARDIEIVVRQSLVQEHALKLLKSWSVYAPILDINNDGFLDASDDLNQDDSITLEDKELYRTKKK